MNGHSGGKGDTEIKILEVEQFQMRTRSQSWVAEVEVTYSELQTRNSKARSWRNCPYGHGSSWSDGRI